MKRKPILVPRTPECPYLKSFGYVYLLTNKNNGHKYIGKHIYKKPYKDQGYWASGGEHLQNALKKLNNDKSQFNYEILEWVKWNGKKSDEEKFAKYLADLEIYYIDLFGTFYNPDDYNETPGGDSWQSGELNPMYGNHRFAGENHPLYGKKGNDSPRFGLKHSNNSKEQMSKKAIERGTWQGKRNPGYNVRKYGKDNPFYGKKHSEETKRKISESNKGRQLIGEQNGMYGKHHSESTKEVIRLANTGVNNHNYGKHMSEEAKQKQRQSHLGKTFSEEHKLLLSKMWKKPVEKISPETNEVIEKFNFGALSIGRNLGISGKKIWQLCINNSNETYEGFIWRFSQEV